MKKKLLYIGIGIAMFPSFYSGVYYLTRDITNLYCFISKSCNPQ